LLSKRFNDEAVVARVRSVKSSRVHRHVPARRARVMREALISLEDAIAAGSF
jgi:hypothetical protein